MKSYRVKVIRILPVQIVTAAAIGIIAGVAVRAIFGGGVRAASGAGDWEAMGQARDFFAEVIQKYLPSEESGLALSYLLGMKSGLTNEISEALRTVGLTHLVVASGTHLSILVGTARKIFGKISRFAGALAAIILILVFASLIGWTASITRAAVVSILTLLAWYTGRKFQAWRIIVLAMAITLIINPANISSLGWLLSFAAYAGIILLAPRLKRFLFGRKKPGRIAETVISSVSASALCLPLQLYFFGAFSLLFLPANLVILPTMPLVMGLTCATGVAGLLLPPLAPVLGWLTARVLDFHLLVVRFLAEQEAFLWEHEPYQAWTLWLYSFVLIWLFPFGLRWLKRCGAKVLRTRRAPRYE